MINPSSNELGTSFKYFENCNHFTRILILFSSLKTLFLVKNHGWIGSLLIRQNLLGGITMAYIFSSRVIFIFCCNDSLMNFQHDGFFLNLFVYKTISSQCKLLFN